MPTTYLEVFREDLDEYFIKSNRSNKIWKFWREILKNMPEELHEEVRKKPTNLEKIHDEENKYKFVTLCASKELREYLGQFTVALPVKQSPDRVGDLVAIYSAKITSNNYPN